MMIDRPYERLIAWQEAHKLCLAVYTVTACLPPEEKYALRSQMRRASYSVPMNIAEGNCKRSPKEKNHFLEISAGSLEELHYQCRLSFDLKYIDQEMFESIDNQLQKVSYLLTRLRQSLKIKH